MGAAPVKAPLDTALTITVHPLAPGVYAARVRWAWVGWFEQGDGLTLVDTGMDDRAAAALEDSIHHYSGNKPFRYVILTHNHDDHTGGARRFLAGGATLVAQAKVAAAIDSALDRPYDVKPRGKRKEPSTIAVEHIKRLGAGDQLAEVVWLGHPAHTVGDLVVYLPKKRVLFAGDIVSYKAVPWLLDPGMSYQGWLASLDSLGTKRFDAVALVPGHGQIPEEKNGIGWTRQYLRDAWEKASQTASWGTSVESFKMWGDLGAYENVEFYNEVHFMNIRRLYTESKGIKTPGRRRAGAVKY